MMKATLKTTFTTALLLATAAAAQQPPPVEVDIVGGGVKSAITIAVPAMPGSPLGRDIAQVIASDLRSTGLFTPLGPGGIGTYPQAQAAAPLFGEWRAAGA
jgi:TolB protein